MRTQNILFPLEMLVRELDYRLFLAVKYVQPHHRIFLGESYHIFRLLQQMEGGIVVGKHIFQSWKNEAGPTGYHFARSRGFGVVHLAEEGAVFFGGDDAIRIELDRQLDPTMLDKTDSVVAWGSFQAQHYKDKGAPCEVLDTGHPRFDLYMERYRALYEREATAIKAKYGKFVLWNTNLGLALHPMGHEWVFSPHEGFHAKDDSRRDRWVSSWARTYRSVASFVELIHRLSLRRKDINFVIRPHPADDETLFRAAFREIPNVHVVREGVVAPWIVASQVMLHDGCTTGIEGYLLGKPVVSYCPEPDPETELFLPNLFGIKCEKRDEAVRLVLDAVERPDHYANEVANTHIPERGHALFANFRTESFPPLLDIMRETEERASRGSRSPSTRQVMRDEVQATAYEAMKAAVRPFSKLRAASARQARAAFFGLKKKAILDRLEIIQKIEKKRVNARFYSPFMMEITSE